MAHAIEKMLVFVKNLHPISSFPNHMKTGICFTSLHGFIKKMSKLTFQKTEEQVKPGKHLRADDEAEFFHEVEKNRGWTDFALETQDGDSDH